MRTKIVVDSATPAEVYNLTLALQRTTGETMHRHVIPTQLTVEPTVTVVGAAMSWASPALTLDHARAVLDEFKALTGADAIRADLAR
jgi:hypothetical protein